MNIFIINETEMSKASAIYTYINELNTSVRVCPDLFLNVVHLNTGTSKFTIDETDGVKHRRITLPKSISTGDLYSSAYK